jgi:two-component system LytT family sensor kinase
MSEQLQRARFRVRRLREFYMHVAVFVVVIGGLALVNWILSPSFWWVAFPAIGWGIGLAIHAVSVFFEDSILGRDWEERKTREIVERQQRGTP